MPVIPPYSTFNNGQWWLKHRAHVRRQIYVMRAPPLAPNTVLTVALEMAELSPAKEMCPRLPTFIPRNPRKMMNTPSKQSCIRKKWWTQWEYLSWFLLKLLLCFWLFCLSTIDSRFCYTAIEHFHVTSLPPCWRAKATHFSSLGNKIYFHAKLFHCFSPPTWPPWKSSIPRIWPALNQAWKKKSFFCCSCLNKLLLN